MIVSSSMRQKLISRKPSPLFHLPMTKVDDLMHNLPMLISSQRTPTNLASLQRAVPYPIVLLS